LYTSTAWRAPSRRLEQIMEVANLFFIAGMGIGVLQALVAFFQAADRHHPNLVKRNAQIMIGSTGVAVALYTSALFFKAPWQLVTIVGGTMQSLAIISGLLMHHLMTIVWKTTCNKKTSNFWGNEKIKFTWLIAIQAVSSGLILMFNKEWPNYYLRSIGVGLLGACFLSDCCITLIATWAHLQKISKASKVAISLPRLKAVVYSKAKGGEQKMGVTKPDDDSFYSNVTSNQQSIEMQKIERDKRRDAPQVLQEPKMTKIGQDRENTASHNDIDRCERDSSMLTTTEHSFTVGCSSGPALRDSSNIFQGDLESKEVAISKQGLTEEGPKILPPQSRWDAIKMGNIAEELSTRKSHLSSPRTNKAIDVRRRLIKSAFIFAILSLATMAVAILPFTRIEKEVTQKSYSKTPRSRRLPSVFCIILVSSVFHWYSWTRLSCFKSTRQSDEVS